ncbi:hypothetical protein DdX_22232 [Ditylenchus destructor]|uniref:Uncharacterized protein n=1 Tax=Ditylenchus destructor TaxID=166010 RepID=A0AAD4MDX4_9BILA|nr:hypothetical protein DdX_22232 [Ditylenchus destructor]
MGLNRNAQIDVLQVESVAFVITRMIETLIESGRFRTLPGDRVWIAICGDKGGGLRQIVPPFREFLWPNQQPDSRRLRSTSAPLQDGRRQAPDLHAEVLVQPVPSGSEQAAPGRCRRIRILGRPGLLLR